MHVLEVRARESRAGVRGHRSDGGGQPVRARARRAASCPRRVAEARQRWDIEPRARAGDHGVDDRVGPAQGDPDRRASSPRSGRRSRSTISGPASPRSEYLKHLPVGELKIDRSFVTGHAATTPRRRDRPLGRRTRHTGSGCASSPRASIRRSARAARAHVVRRPPGVPLQLPGQSSDIPASARRRGARRSPVGVAADGHGTRATARVAERRRRCRRRTRSPMRRSRKCVQI